MCVSVGFACMSAPCSCNVQGGQERTSGPLELELQLWGSFVCTGDGVRALWLSLHLKQEIVFIEDASKSITVYPGVREMAKQISEYRGYVQSIWWASPWRMNTVTIPKPASQMTPPQDSCSRRNLCAIQRWNQLLSHSVAYVWLPWPLGWLKFFPDLKERVT